jgi:hypothetical protein
MRKFPFLIKQLFNFLKVIGNEIKSGSLKNYCIKITWVISEVLHTVCFLFKNEFILQNTFTVLQCNLDCVLSQWSTVWASLVFLYTYLLYLNNNNVGYRQKHNFK